LYKEQYMNVLIKVLLIIFITTGYVYAEGMGDIPHVNQKAEDSFKYDYTYANTHRAYAIAPGGAWSWRADAATKEQAQQQALEACEKYSEFPCVLYAVNKEIVFDSQQWFTLWGPYKNRQQAATAETGNKPGQRFPNLVFTDPAGIKKTISDMKGKVVFVHLWGCWCPPCRVEFVTLIDMYRILQDTLGDQVEFVVLQLREPISQARAWAKKNGLDTLPLSDSGVANPEDKFLTTKSGEKIPDRQLAHVFPSSYVIDKHGIVIFSHMGSVEDWSEYVGFFKDAVKNSGK